MECERASESLSHTDERYAVALRGVRFARHGTISELNSLTAAPLSEDLHRVGMKGKVYHRTKRALHDLNMDS